MKWSYKTVHFELKKEGLLGGAFLDEAEIEEQLNDFGRSGWELISVLEVQDGIIAFFKQSLDLKLRPPQPAEDGETGLADKGNHMVAPLNQPDPEALEELDPEQSVIADDDDIGHYDETSEESYLLHEAVSTAAGRGYNGEPWTADSDGQHKNQKDEEIDDDPLQSGIGAIKIE